MFDLFSGVFSKLEQSWFGTKIDTWVDKLNRNVSVVLLIAMALLVSAKQYVGEPIHCRQTSTQDGNYEKYMNDICWVTNTYYVANHQSISQSEGLEEFNRINYYQWVPIILLIQALMFYLPYLIWQAFIQKSGLDLITLMTTGGEVTVADGKDEREKKLRYMANQMDGYLRHYQDLADNTYASIRNKLAKKCHCLFGKRGGSFIVILYIFIKMLYFANVVGQIFILENLLTDDIHGYAVNALSSLLLKSGWPQSEIFPRSTMCRFELRALGNQVHTHIVQCVLSINFFHEKVYIAIWMWFVIVAVLTGISLFYWILRFIFRADRVRYIKRHLKAMEKISSDKERRQAYRFVENYLKHDGVFAIRMINMNVSGMVAAQLISELWDEFRFKPLKNAEDQTALKHLEDETDVHMV